MRNPVVTAQPPASEAHAGSREVKAETRPTGELVAGPGPVDLLSTVESTSPSQMWQALHELRLRQIELEVQNEELRQAQIAAETSRAHYRELYQTAPVGYLVLGDNGATIVEANRCAANVLGAVDSQALIRQPLTHFILPDDQDRLYLLKKRAIDAGVPQAGELRLVRADKAVVRAQLTAAAQVDNGTLQLRVVLRELEPAKPAIAALTATSATIDAPLPRQLALEAAHRSCARCGLRQSCLPAGLGPGDLELLDRHIESPRPLATGQILARQNTSMRSVYVVRSGALKSTIIHGNGDRQIIGLYLPSELICPGALYQRHFRCEVEALQRSQLCAVPWERMQELTERLPALQAQFLHLLMRETVHDHDHLVALGKHSALHRVVQFLCSLSRRRLRQHLDPDDLMLPMTRADIGNFLNLAEETVCRVLARLQLDGVLSLRGKRVQIIDHQTLFGLCEEPDQRVGRHSG